VVFYRIHARQSDVYAVLSGVNPNATFVIHVRSPLFLPKAEIIINSFARQDNARDKIAVTTCKDKIQNAVTLPKLDLSAPVALSDGK